MAKVRANTSGASVLLVLLQLYALHRSLTLAALDANAANEARDEAVLASDKRLLAAQRTNLHLRYACGAEQVAASDALARPREHILADWALELYAQIFMLEFILVLCRAEIKAQLTSIYENKFKFHIRCFIS